MTSDLDRLEERSRSARTRGVSPAVGRVNVLVRLTFDWAEAAQGLVSRASRSARTTGVSAAVGRVEARLACAESGYPARPGKATTGVDSCTGISAPP
jgi:hypothetical protein